MSNIYDFKSAKQAKINLKTATNFHNDLKVVIKEMNSTINKLAPYIKYRAVSRALCVIKEELQILKIQSDQCQQIVKEKGKVKDE